MSQEDFVLSNSSYEKMINVVDDSKQHNKTFTQDRSKNVQTHNIVEGRNVFRISPGLKEGGVPYMPIRYSLMQVEVDEYTDQGEPTGRKIWTLKRCYVATQHGPRKDGKSLIKKDPIEFYIESVIKVCRQKASNEQDFEKSIASIKGYRDQSGKYIWGIQPFTRIVCYAWDLQWKLGRLELYQTWFEQMKGINTVENAKAETQVDVFSDPKNGGPVVIDKTITKTPNRTKTDYAVTQLQLDKNSRESWDDYFQRFEINQERIEDLKQVKTVEELYWESYTLEHFLRVKKALIYFDEKNGYDLFRAPVFSNQWERLEAHIKEFVKPKEPVAAVESTEIESIAKVLRQPYDELTNEQVINVLQAYVDYKYGQGQLLPVLTPNEMKIWFRIAQKGEDLPLANVDANDETDDLPF